MVQISGYLDLLLASFLAVGAVGALGWAYTLYVLPVSLFGMSVAAAELPELSRQTGAPQRSVYLARLDAGRQVTHDVSAGRHAWLQVLRGNVSLNGHDLNTSDGAAVSEEALLTIRATTDAEIMLFDLASVNDR